MPIKAILFDKDGTLIDFHATWGAATLYVLEKLSDGDKGVMERLAEQADFDLSTGTIGERSEIIAGAPSDLAALWAPLLGREANAAMEDEINAHYSQASSSTLRGFTSTEAVLQQLQALGMPLGVGTNDSEANALQHMAALGWTDYFDIIMGYDSGHGAKPGPGMIHAFSELTGLPTSMIAMVGDSTHDLETAKNANAIAVGVTTGPAGRDVLLPHADHVIDGLDQLSELISNS